MDNKEHYNQFRGFLEVAKTQEINVKDILIRMGNVLATQNYVIIEKLDKILEALKKSR